MCLLTARDMKPSVALYTFAAAQDIRALTHTYTYIIMSFIHNYVIPVRCAKFAKTVGPCNLPAPALLSNAPLKMFFSWKEQGATQILQYSTIQPARKWRSLHKPFDYLSDAAVPLPPPPHYHYHQYNHHYHDHYHQTTTTTKITITTDNYTKRCMNPRQC